MGIPLPLSGTPLSGYGSSHASLPSHTSIFAFPIPVFPSQVLMHLYLTCLFNKWKYPSPYLFKFLSMIPWFACASKVVKSLSLCLAKTVTWKVARTQLLLCLALGGRIFTYIIFPVFLCLPHSTYSIWPREQVKKPMYDGLKDEFDNSDFGRPQVSYQPLTIGVRPPHGAACQQPVSKKFVDLDLDMIPKKKGVSPHQGAACQPTSQVSSFKLKEVKTKSVRPRQEAASQFPMDFKDEVEFGRKGVRPQHEAARLPASLILQKLNFVWMYVFGRIWSRGRPKMPSDHTAAIAWYACIFGSLGRSTGRPKMSCVNLLAPKQVVYGETKKCPLCTMRSLRGDFRKKCPVFPMSMHKRGG